MTNISRIPEFLEELNVLIHELLKWHENCGARYMLENVLYFAKNVIAFGLNPYDFDGRHGCDSGEGISVPCREE